MEKTKRSKKGRSKSLSPEAKKRWHAANKKKTRKTPPLYRRDRKLKEPVKKSPLKEQIGGNHYKSPLKEQIGGNHYKSLQIQPVEYIQKNRIPFMEGSAIKYLTRWRDKGGIQDLQKAKHFIEMLIEFETSK